jgi:16S rRNA (guanine527-N7)-methyltransferase
LSEDYAAIIAAEFRHIHLTVSDEACEKLTRYCDELERWNRRINLTSLRGEPLVGRLIVEPVWIATDLEMSGVIVDIGSGNGSPAIPIRCCRDVKSMHLVEARTRRAAFLRHLAATLGLRNTHIHRAVFQDVVEEIPSADWITLQAVAPSTELQAAIRKIAKPGATRVLWITSDEAALQQFPDAEKHNLPFSKTSAVLLRL